MENKTLLERVEKEFETFESRKKVIMDHLDMIHSHLFEEFRGENTADLLSDIDHLISKIGRIL